jgi:alkylation response protein AidB-like acyl-CoA dehydrogenase
MRFEFTELTPAELALQADVRAFLAEELPPGSFEPGLGMAARPDREFSRKLAARHWVGMALPAEYGGGDRSPVERFVVVEELLRWGAPVGYHWFADRQSGPLIARVGTSEQKQRFLPAVCLAEISFCVGMSEPDAGSDLASVKTRAVRVDGGWTVSGTKLWTTGAHYHDWMITLVRTSDEGERHRGLSQVLVDLHDSRVHVNPIPFIDGTADFNEVVLDEVFVPDTQVLGEVGNGWAQVNSELALERAGPERWLSTYLLVEQLLREHPAHDDPRPSRPRGSHFALVGDPPTVAVDRPDGGTGSRAVSGSRPRQGDGEPIRTGGARRRVFAARPRTVALRRLVARASRCQRGADQCQLHRAWGHDRDLAVGCGKGPSMTTDPLLRETVERCFDELCTHDVVQAAERSGWADELWEAARQMGLPWISLPVSGGGSGGTLADAVEVLRIAGRHAVPLPLAETGLLAGWLLSEAGLALDDEPMTLVPGRPDDTLVLDGGLLRGEAHRVAWGRRLTHRGG